MRKGLIPLPITTEGNGSNIIQLSIDKADIPMLVHALSIGASTVMLCGSGDTERRMRHYQKSLEALVPPGWKHFRNEEDVSNIILAINTTPKCVLEFKKQSWRDNGSVVITVGDYVWSTYLTTLPQCLEMIEFMKAILPLNCEFEVTGDIPEQT